MFRSRPVSLALVGLFVWVTGCHSYKQIELAEMADCGKVRVTLTDGSQIIQTDVTVEGDSIHYWQKAEPPAKYEAMRVASPLDQVEAVELVQPGIGPSVIYAAVFGFLFGAGIFCVAGC